MYIPAAFQEPDLTRLHDFIEAHRFGLLVSTLDGIPFATHLPLLLERRPEPHGTLVGHVARANPQWQTLEGQQVLAVFSGPHAYISPSWYESENVVPTWNYVAVHAYGRCHLVEDTEGVTRILQTTVATYESRSRQPWSVDSSTDFFAKLVRQVVAFRIEVTRLEGKWKLNQNHPAERREKVVRSLRQRGGENAEAIAALMEASLGR